MDEHKDGPTSLFYSQRDLAKKIMTRIWRRRKQKLRQIERNTRDWRIMVRRKG